MTTDYHFAQMINPHSSRFIWLSWGPPVYGILLTIAVFSLWQGVISKNKIKHQCLGVLYKTNHKTQVLHHLLYTLQLCSLRDKQCNLIKKRDFSWQIKRNTEQQPTLPLVIWNDHLLVDCNLMSEHEDLGYIRYIQYFLIYCYNTKNWIEIN